MLSERLTELFHLLQCTNSDIARFAGCSPSNISRLKSGIREPKPGSHSVMRLVQGVYRYADYENLLRVLKDLCGSEETQAEILIPAIIRWLYEDQAYVLPQQILPRSKREREKQLKTFGQRLDKVMTLLELTNARLAAGLNIDVSMISRYRSGIYHPRRNKQVREHVCELLSARAEKRGMTAELAALCGVPAEKFGNEKLAEWLYSQDEDFSSEIAESVFRSIDTYAPGQGMPSPPPTLPKIQETDCYWGTPGIQQAVIRFLSDAAREGGRLLLYSDEPMDWMSGDREFFAVWTSLMNACVNAGVQIKIIHNLDRSGQEMIAAMAGWLPLYISGKIEPYVLRKNKDPRFFHTIFLRPGRAAVLGFFPVDAGEKRWYGYITDPDRLNSLQAGYHTMLVGASPFLRTYPAAKMDDFWDLYRARSEKKYALLRGLSVASMPEKLLKDMMDRIDLPASRRERAVKFCSNSRAQLDEILKTGEMHEFLCLPDAEAVEKGQVNVNFGPDPACPLLTYTPEDYAAHCKAACELVGREKNYHISLLPYAPFQDLQIFTMKDSVAVLRCREPSSVFVFFSGELSRSMAYYCDSLTAQYATDRFTTAENLMKMVTALSKTGPAGSA